MDKKILIVEDEQDIASVFKKQLDLRGGFEVELASNGKEGLDKMAAGKYDLVFLDLVMPEMDGIEVIKAVNADKVKYNAPEIIALTNVTSDDTMKEVQDLGVYKFVIKTDVDIDVVADEFFG